MRVPGRCVEPDLDSGSLDSRPTLPQLPDVSTAAKTVDEYLASLPEDRRSAISAVRTVILSHLPEGYAECIQCGMIAYVVPHSLYAALASQKNYMALYLMTVSGDLNTEQWFRKAYQASGPWPEAPWRTTSPDGTRLAGRLWLVVSTERCSLSRRSGTFSFSVRAGFTKNASAPFAGRGPRTRATFGVALSYQWAQLPRERPDLRS